MKSEHNELLTPSPPGSEEKQKGKRYVRVVKPFDDETFESTVLHRNFVKNWGTVPPMHFRQLFQRLCPGSLSDRNIRG
eukprot:3998949-Amphidinium_carterae.1